jgi:hypothetical protein
LERLPAPPFGLSERYLPFCRLKAWGTPCMMTKKSLLPTLGRKLAPALLFLLPVAPLCAQNAPANGAPASPATGQQAQPTAGPGQNAPAQSAPAQTTPASAAPAQTPKANAAPSQAKTGEAEPNRAQAYYHLALASVYEDDAVSDSRSD